MNAAQVEREAALPIALNAAVAASDAAGGVKFHVDAGVGLRGRHAGVATNRSPDDCTTATSKC